MPLTPQQEMEIYPILDKVTELQPRQGILYKCTIKRADYLVRMIQGLRYDSAIESIEIYPPGHPLHGKGLYADLWVEVQPQGLLATKLPEPHDSVMWRLIQCAASRSNVSLPHGTSFGQARVRLGRAQKKYPEIMNAVYLTNEEPITARYGEPTDEEMIIVDIDTNPDSDVRRPTDEEKAKQASATPYKPATK